MPGTAPPSGNVRLAGQAAAENPDFMQRLWTAVTGRGQQAKDAIKGATQAAPGRLQNANQALGRGMLNNSGRMLAGGTVLSLLAAAGELGDENDPMLRNLAEAGGVFGGGWGGFAAGAALGAPIAGPIGSLALGTLGSIYGADALKNMAGGLYDIIADESPTERDRKRRLAETETAMAVANLKHKSMLPIQKDILELKRADDFARAERDLQIRNEYNFANSLNQEALMRQQASTLQDLAMNQYLMG